MYGTMFQQLRNTQRVDQRVNNRNMQELESTRRTIQRIEQTYHRTEIKF